MSSASASLQSGWLRIQSSKELGHSLVAKTDVPKGTMVAQSKGKVRKTPTLYTVAVEEGIHVDVDSGVQYTAHCCEPNCRMKVEYDIEGNPIICLESIRQIREGELCTFNYNTTEWDMAAPFDCYCYACKKSKDRKPKRIAGMKHLNKEERNQLRDQVSPYIAKKLAQACSSQ